MTEAKLWVAARDGLWLQEHPCGLVVGTVTVLCSSWSLGHVPGLASALSGGGESVCLSEVLDLGERTCGSNCWDLPRQGVVPVCVGCSFSAVNPA